MVPIRKFYNNIELILKKGISTEEYSSEKHKATAKSISLVLNSGHSPYIGYVHDEGKTIHIETSYFDPVLSVEVTKNGIFFIPLVDTGWHGAFFEILKIIYLYEQKRIDQQKEEEDSTELDWI